MYIVNKANRVIESDDDAYCYELLKREEKDFREATEAEIENFLSERNSRLFKAGLIAPEEDGVLLHTVTAGGKDGYGTASAKLYKKLRAKGFPISTSNCGQKTKLVFHSPPAIEKLEGECKVLFSMFESTKLPKRWIDDIKLADHVIVPSHFCKDLFDQYGVDSIVVPLGYDDSIFTYKPKVLDESKPFTFLHYNAFNMRKGFTDLFNAFTEEFTEKDNVRLILKTIFNSVPAGMPINPRMYPNIKIIFGGISDSELAKLNQDADCFIFPSRGEGFGMTPLEAMACGTAPIVPDAHGISEYFDSRYMIGVETEECPACYTNHDNAECGKMVRCTHEDLKKQMRWAYDHRKAVHEMGARAAEYAKNYTWDQTADKLIEILNAIIKPVTKEKTNAKSKNSKGATTKGKNTQGKATR